MKSRKPGFVAAHCQRMDSLRATLWALENDVVQRLYDMAPHEWHRVGQFRDWIEHLVQDGEYSTRGFELRRVPGWLNFRSVRQFKQALRSLRAAWNGNVRVVLRSDGKNGYFLLQLRAI